MDKSPKPRISASCLATMSSKSTISGPTMLRDVGTPAIFCTKHPQLAQRCLKRVREAFYTKEKTSEKGPGYMRTIFRKARKIVMVENDKIPACHRSTESGWVTTGAELPGSQNNDPSNTASDVLSAEQNACLIALRTSQTASLVVPIVPRETCLRDLLENSPRRHPFSTVQRDTHVVEETLRVAYDQGQRMRSMSSPHNTGAVYADRVSVKRDALPSHDTDNTDPEPSPKSPCLADSPDHTHRLTSPEPSTLTAPSHAKLRQRLSAPAILAISHSPSGSGSTLVGSSFPSPTIATPSSSDFPVTENKTRDEETEASQDSRAFSSSEEDVFHYMDPHTVSDAWQESVASGIKMIKVVQDMEWAKRLDESVAEAKAAKDKEWANRLESAVAEAEIAKDKVWETVDQFKETSHSNEIQDLKEDHAHEIKEIEERHAETLQELATKHDEEVQQLIRKHGAEARRLDMRRAQGAKEVKKLKEDFAEIEAENKATKKSLIHMTGQRDALFKAFVDMKGQSSPQVIPPLEPSQSEHFHNHLHGQVESIHDTANRQFRPVINTKVSAADETESPASDRSTPQPHQQGQQSQAPIVPNALYPRLQFLESENAQLRADLDQRHEDVRYAVGKADKLRGLLQDDPAKAETYPDILIHQELIEDLQTRLEESHKATERERLEAQRLRDRIDIVTADMQSETLGRELALKDKEAAWEQNETLLKHLKGRFTKSDFDNAFWTQYESLAKEKEHSEGEIAGYKREHRNLMEEAVDRRTKIAELELGAQHTNDDGGEHGLLDLKNEILVLQIANDALKAELAFQLAEQDNRAVGQQMPKSLRDARDRVPEGKSREIARLEAGLEGWEVVDQGRKRDVEGGEGLDACADTPKSDYGFF